MKIDFIKHPGGVLIPASDMEQEKLTKFKTGGQYQVEIKLTRNPAFHRKAFAFFNFCFEHWSGDNEFTDITAQFDKFRKDLTILAGFSKRLYNIRGELRLEAESLSFSNMNQERFEQVYNALINAAMKNIFHTADVNTENKLMSFF